MKRSVLSVRRCVLLIFFTTSLSLSAQHLYLPASAEQRLIAERSALHDTTKKVHLAIQPYARGEFGTDRFARLSFADSLALRKKKSFWHWLDRKVFNEHLVQLKGDDFVVNLDPWINTEIGVDPNRRTANSSFTFLSTRGIWMEGRIGRQFTFFSGFAENLGAFQDYLHDYYNYTKTGMVIYGGH